jgi:hypothetical protein
VIFESARITARLLLEDMEMEPTWNPAPRLKGAAAWESVR